MNIKPIPWMTTAQRIRNREQVIDILVANRSDDPEIFELIDEINQLRQLNRKES